MGLFVSKLLSNDVATLELMMSEIARAIREGQVEVRKATDTLNTHNTPSDIRKKRERHETTQHTHTHMYVFTLPCPPASDAE